MLFRFISFILLAPVVFAGDAIDVRPLMERADRFGRGAGALVLRDEIRPFWSGDGSRFAYRVDTAAKQHRFFQVDLKTGGKSPAFDHAALAEALAAKTGKPISADALPIDHLEPPAESGTILFRAAGRAWVLTPATGEIAPDGAPPAASPLLPPQRAMSGRHGGNGAATSLTVENATTGRIEVFWVARRNDHQSYGTVAPGESRTLATYAGHVWLFTDDRGMPLAGTVAEEGPSFARVTGKVEAPAARPGDLSPDGAWRAAIRDHNVALIPENGGEAVPLSTDGTQEYAYSGPFHWAPDSRKLAAFRAKAVNTRRIHIVRSTPPDQLQPRLVTHDYPKPGDPLQQPKPCLFDVAGRRGIPVNDEQFANPWSITDGGWNADSSEFSFVYNQRGHQAMRVVALRADSGSARVLLEETSRTFIDYSQKYFFQRLGDGNSFLWASERSGFNHLYRFDSRSGRLLNPITQGDWNVREVVEVDEKKRRILVKLVGLPGSDPYYEHFARVDFEGGGFTRLTHGDGNHRLRFSPDGMWYLDTWSRADLPPVTELRRAADGSLVAELERADDSLLTATGWSRPERFAAKGRDGKTDIFGVIIRPTRFDPAAKHPVIEDIYAGPHDQFVPKSYAAWSGAQTMAELGFIVVKIDGMGTNWRNKKFHDVCWKNLMDAGFPDRIPWIKAAAATRPWMDTGRVGVFGGSAGGQSALAALLHHGDFYQAAVADCGCHDNRMDKVWWNEAWMGWPVDESYERNSNTTHAAKLKGSLMLIVGELDDNVDPASTYQVVAALQKAGKHFDFVPVINAGHGAAETPYGRFRKADFLVRHLGARPLP